MRGSNAIKTFVPKDLNLPLGTEIIQSPIGRQAAQEQDFELQRAIFDAIPASVAVIDHDGHILDFNESWKRYAGINPLFETPLEIGENYLEACVRIHGENADDAAAVVHGLRGVLSGTREEFVHEFRRKSKGGKRWYRLRAAPFTSRQQRGAMLLFTDITKRGEAMESLQIAERKYRSIFENATEGIFQTSLAGQYLVVNPMLAKIYGYESGDDLIGSIRNIGQQLYVNPGRRDEFIQVLEAKDMVYQFESAIRRKDGNIIWISENARAVRDAAGSLLYYEGTVVDITELKHAEEQIRNQAALLDKAHDAIVVQDLEHRIQYWNKSAERIYGWTSAEVAGSDAGALLHLEMSAFERALAVALAEGGWFGEFKHRRKDGTEVIVESTLTLVRDAEGRPKSILAINIDATEKRNLERQVIHSQRMDSLGTLAGGIAHDFNNILAIISGFAQMGRVSVPPNHPAQRSLAAIEMASQRAVAMVRQILTFSRRQETERRVTELPPVVKEAVGFLRTTLPSKIEIVSVNQTAIPPIFADATQIHQIIINLGTNAAHAMRDRGGRLEIQLELVEFATVQVKAAVHLPPGRYARLVVSDTGSGMDAQTLPHIFEPFFTTKARGEGCGLGLAVVHGIVKNHDGAIEVSSELGKGSVFRLYFPALEAEPARKERRKPKEVAGQGRRILYVDDEKDLVLLTTLDLQARGYLVSGHTLPEEALAAFRAAPHQFDAAVVDMSMPRLDGTELCRQLLGIRPDLPVVMVSGFFRPEDTEKVRAVGITMLVEKPQMVALLGGTLDQVFKQAHRR